jgi:hypothetical protein
VVRSGPIFEAYSKALSSKFGALKYTPQGPPASGIIDCGSYSHPDVGCSEEAEDSATAYLQSLLFAINGTTQYAANAIAILNRYAAGLKQYTNSNAPLQAAWSGMYFTKAAELMKHSDGSGWRKDDQEALSTMLNTVMLPLIVDGSGANGNWELSMLDAMIGLSVLDENTTLFDHTVALWRQRSPSYFWTVSDGPYPDPVPRPSGLAWNHSSPHCEPTPRSCSATFYGQNVFNGSTDGVCQETCRDLGHVQMGMASLHYVAETAFIQGVDLWTEEERRLSAGMEFHSQLLMQKGDPSPAYLCPRPTFAHGDKVNGTQHSSPTFVVGYNAVARRMGTALPLTARHIEEQVLPLQEQGSALIYMYETMTHGAGSAPADFDVLSESLDG